MRESPSFLDDARTATPFRSAARRYMDLLLSGDRAAASRLVLDLVHGPEDVRRVYLEIFQPVQYEIGRMWQINKISVAQEHFCTAATQLIMSQLFPYIVNGGDGGRTLVSCCVGGELHEIGLRMVTDFFEMEGWNTYYLGANTPDSSVVSAAAENAADLVGISVTMTHNVHLAARLVQQIRHAARSDLRLSKTRIMVGGFPFLLNPDLWRSIGADASAGDAAEAVQAGRLLAGAV